MRVVAVVPYRSTPGRDPLLRAVLACLAEALPDAQSLLVDAGRGGGVFNRAASRNLGVREAFADYGAQVVVLCDADTVPEVEPLREAVAQVGVGQLHLPFTWFRMLTATGTDAWFNGDPYPASVTEEHDRAVGGVLVCTPGTWWTFGGQDEGFSGWGCEDTAFWTVASTLGTVVRYEGTITHLWHPGADAERGIWSPAYRRNAMRCKLYTDARGDPARMRTVLAAIGAPGMWSGVPA